MNNDLLEKNILISRYNELKQIVKPILNKESIEQIFSDSLDNCSVEAIKKIIVITLKKIGNIVSSGIFLVILLNYKDLIECDDPVKVMNLARRAKKNI